MYRRQVHPSKWTHPATRRGEMRKNHSFSRPPVKTTASRAGLKLRVIKSDEALPESFAWHPETLTEIRDQGQCGTCWAFATATSLADRIMIQSKGAVNVPLSAQHFVNCASYPGNGPCDGNDVGWALAHVPRDGFIAESVRPYRMINGGNQVYQCKVETDPSEYEVKVPTQTSYCLTSGNHTPADIQNMKAHIYHEGPIIGAMLAVYPDLSNYDGLSIYEPAPGQESEGGHAIEIVGWGKNQDGVEYWICRNSWGPSWPQNHLEGMGKGWFYVKMGSNVCRMEEYAYASVPDMVNQANAPDVTETDAFSGQSGVPSVDPSYTPSGYTSSTSDGDSWNKTVFNLLILLLIALIIYKIAIRKKH